METFSVNYYKEDEDSYAADWGMKTNGKWSWSWKEYGLGHQWHIEEGLPDDAYQATLEHFGLEDYADEFPAEKVISMSPAVLAAARREKEEMHGLERLEIFSDIKNGRDDHPAEDYK